MDGWNAPYTPSSTVALARTSGRSLGTFKSHAVSVIRKRFWRLHWANTSAVGTTSWYLTPINSKVELSWLAFVFRIWWLSRNLTVARLSLGHSRWCLHRVTEVCGSLYDVTSCNAVNGKCLLRTCLHPSSGQKGCPNVSTCLSNYTASSTKKSIHPVINPLKAEPGWNREEEEKE